ncbi:MAG: hypothetical protein J1D77_03970 [Muribaculaceae bacterium]|nr:hypothetical protein [Muribaculaceae bacterium]
MKKITFLCAGFAMMLAMTSCKTNIWTATQVHVPTTVCSASVANLQVGNRITYTYYPTAQEKKGGLKNCKNAAIAAMLKENGNADVIVAPEFNYDNTLKAITVTGRPASYSNFTPAPILP